MLMGMKDSRARPTYSFRNRRELYVEPQRSGCGVYVCCGDP